jgi:hypothetical protein
VGVGAEVQQDNVIKVNQQESNELNDWIARVCDEPIDGFIDAQFGKTIPYIGWFWRTVPFCECVTIGRIRRMFYNGFMVNNKWDYPQRDLIGDELDKVVNLLLTAKQHPTAENFRNLHEYIQQLDLEA